MSPIRRTPAPAVLSLLAVLAAPAAAHAADYCVGAAPGCSGTSKPFTQAGLQEALNLAAADQATADRVMIGPGTLPITSTVGLNSAAVEVIGAGQNQTTISAAMASDSIAVNLNGVGSATTKFRDLTIKLASSASPQPRILSAATTTVERVRLIDESGASNIVALSLSAGKFVDGSVVTPASSGTGVMLHSPQGGDVFGSVVEAENGIRISGGSHQIRRTIVRKSKIALTMDAGVVDIADSLFDLGATANAKGIEIANPNNGVLSMTATVKRSTVAGSGPNQKGVFVQADSAGETSTASMTDTVSSLTGQGSVDVRCSQAAMGTATLTTKTSAFATLEQTGSCMPASTGRIALAAAALKFVDRATGDYRLQADSPLVDAGTSVPGVDETLDVLGKARVADGNGAGGAQVDIGAAEYQLPEPDPQSGGQGGMPEPQGGQGGETPQGGGQGQGGETPQGGQGEAPQGGQGGETPQGGGLGEAPQAAPTVAVTAKPKSALLRGKTGFSLAKGASRRTFGLTLGSADAVQLTVAKRTKGKDVALKGSATVKTSSPAVRLAFGGTFGRKRLAAGSYRLTVTPLRGNAKGKPVTIGFRVAK